MKEAALSAAALMGLMGFAAYYNNAGQSNRARRDIEPESYDDGMTNIVFNETYITEGDFQPSEADLIRLLQELEWTGDADLDADDVLPYQNKIPKVNFKRITRNKFGDPNWNAAFRAAHAKRFNNLKTWLSFNDFRVSVSKASVEAEEEQPNYNGYDTTHPHVQAMLDQQNVKNLLETQNFFSVGQNTIFVVLPTEVPLNSEINENVRDYGNYWKFIFGLRGLLDKYRGRITSRATPKIMLGRQSSKRIAWLSANPQKYNKRRYPWARVMQSTNKPSLSALQPFESQHIQELGNRIDADGGASPSQDRDCWVFKFHQDLPQDSNQFLLPETQTNAMEIRSRCTFIDIFAGFKHYDEDIMKLWTAYDPNLQAVSPMDNDFSGFFIVEKHTELIEDSFKEAVYKYMALAKTRTLCRCSEEAYEPPVTAAPATAAGEVTAAGDVNVATAPPATDGPLETAAADAEERELTAAPAAEEVGDATEAPTVAGVLEGTTIAPKETVIDSCCGIGLAGKPYDSELSTCCEDGVVMSWNDDGTDPCNNFNF